MTPSALYAILPRGSANGTSIRALARQLDTSERTVRDGLRYLVVDEHKPIVTLPTDKGVYLATTAEDLAPARAHLRSKLVSLRERMDALELAAQNLAWRPTLFG